MKVLPSTSSLECLGILGVYMFGVLLVVHEWVVWECTCRVPRDCECVREWSA